MDTKPPFHSDDVSKLLLRLAVGGLMLFHGTNKLFYGVGIVGQALQSAGLPESLAYSIYIGEVLAPALILLGFWTRPAAVVEALTMVLAVILAERENVLVLGNYGGWHIELNAFFFLGALALFFSGAGKFSISRGKGWWN